MDENQAKKLLDETFNTNFDINRFSMFVKELFNEFNITQRERHAWSEFKSHIDTYQFLGSYTDKSKKSIDVLAVKLKRTSSIDRARTKQRNFVAKYLGDNNKDAALVAFYDDDMEDWRFSFVKLDYHLERDESGKVKPVEDLTPAKRYSYLVGVNEPNHTCKSQFLDLLVEEGTNPSLDEIEAAFSIEKVTKKFFEKYRELFYKLRDALDNAIKKYPNVKEEFEEKDIKADDFAKKLLGQIVFLYFLQKKGWLGVEKDNNTGKFLEWGRGHKKFLTKLVNGDIVDYEKITGDHDKFFNDILEPLFYSALATPRENDYYEIFDYKCKIPFLNGGLFEPLNYYNWQETDILLDNQIFKDIIKTFDEFNFTVKEDEPLDKEVAVDPEMLGKVFENLLTDTDRKSKGAFYTPREIVHYMCQQSLINYLETNTDVPVGDIETFIKHGELAQQITSRTDVNDKYLPTSVKNNYNKINTLLKNIKIVDPAVGSGAFPMGMMNEIVKARYILSYLNKDDKPNYYDLKRETIEKCLYGVDIDSSAVDITKLRFWLSLVVDETNIKDIKPLPNLDYRIMCGNSLLEEFEGVKLFDEKLLVEIPKDDSLRIEEIKKEIDELNQELHEIYTGKKKDNGRKDEIDKEIKKLDRKKKEISTLVKEETQQYTLDQIHQQKIKESQKKLKELRNLQKDFFKEESKKTKKELADKIDKIEWGLIEETLKEQGNEAAMQKLAQYKKNKSKPFFLWKLYFSEVFQRENPGFDVVIANPPYLGENKHKEIFREIKQGNLGNFYLGKMDIFYFFLNQALNLGNNGSQVVFITTNYYPTAMGAKKLRQDFKERAIVRKLINFNELKIFDSAKGQHNMITILTKGHNNNALAETCITKRIGVATPHILQNITSLHDQETNYYSVIQKDLYEGAELYIRLTGNSSDNQSPIQKILDKIKKQDEFLGEICNINQGVVSGCDYVSNRNTEKLKNDKSEIQHNDGIFVFDLKNKRDEKVIEHFSNDEKKLLRPFFKNSDINRYFCRLEPTKLLLYTGRNFIAIKQYPNIENHLKKFMTILEDRREVKNKVIDFFQLQWPRTEEIFVGEKIIVPYRSNENSFAYNNVEWFCRSDSYVITKKDLNFNIKYILALLNSKLYFIWLYHKGKRKGEILELFQVPLSEIPIVKISSSEQKPFINLVDQILSLTNSSDYLDSPEKQARVKTFEKEIDQLVYKLYDLTPEEIAIVENFNKGK